MMSLFNKTRFHLMRSVQNKRMRDAITSSIVRRIGKIQIPSGTSIFLGGEENLDELSKKFLKDGILFLPINLPNEYVEKLIEYSNGLESHDPYEKHLGTFKPDNIPEMARVAQFSGKDLVKNKTIMNLANDPGILKLVQAYLGAKPTISSIDMWWSRPQEKDAIGPQLFHRDVSDFRFCKLFIYLTDVDKESGPHVYIKQTSVSKEFRKIKRYEDAEIYEKFGTDKVLEMVAPRGTAFLEDTYGFHKGVPPSSKNRLIFQVQYSLNPVYGYTYNPQNMGYKNNYDKYINRLYIK